MPGCLPLYVGMRLLIFDKLCASLGLMKGCECIVEEIYLNPSEDLSKHSAASGPICLEFQPAGLLARVPDVSWRLPAEHLPPS
eukprot:209904-Alexandrium_andersonii.AAC.1